MTVHSAITDRWAYPSYGGSGCICSMCGYWVPAGNAHFCNTTVTPWQGSWQCASCREQVSGFHICNGSPVPLPVGGPALEQRPESPLAALVADLRALLAKGQSWLAERKI